MTDVKAMEMREGSTGIITDIQRFSVHDGPGIRTLVFFKGCPLRCQWCQNPETRSAECQIIYNKDLCISCGACKDVCRNKATYYDGAGYRIDWDKCTACGECTKACYTKARKLVGRKIAVEELVQELLRDKVFYETSNGGVTLSGGEPTAQMPFAKDLLKKLKKEGINTAIETCGFCDGEGLIGLLTFVDYVLFDIKHTDDVIHKKYTGVSNKLILENLYRIAAAGKKIIVRVPLIPGINDTVENLNETARIAKGIHAEEIHLLPFHQMGESKWHELGYDYEFANMVSPKPEEIEKAKMVLERYGNVVNIGGGGERY